MNQTATLKVTERQFQDWVTETAGRFGWKWWHVPAPMRHTRSGFVGASEAAGLPDLILTHHDPPRLVFAELKAGGGKITPQQREFLQAVKRVADNADDIMEADTYDFTPLIGVYAWWPGMEAPIETLLRTRVLT